ncbi:MAG: C25 family cysteine peptidase [Candidatus Poribacteria bacterium]|nr:C25 family cysteine peptidase [Candidatus Poribacteria bacterium]
MRSTTSPHLTAHNTTFVLLIALSFISGSISAGQIVRPDANGVTIEFDLTNLTISEVEVEGQIGQGQVKYHRIHYGNREKANRSTAESTGRLSEVGNPQLPVSRFIIGVPPQSKPWVEAIQTITSRRYGIRVLPTPHQTITSGNSVQLRQQAQLTELSRTPLGGNSSTSTFGSEEIQTHYLESGSAYQDEANYPEQVAAITYDGFIRSQRVIYLELHPVQYHPRSRTLLTNTRLVVRLHFGQKASGSMLTQGASIDHRMSSSDQALSFPEKVLSLPTISEPAIFERLFQHQLINADQARQWRQRKLPGRLAPMMQPNSDELQIRRYKIYVSQTGIYRLTESELRNRWQIDLRRINPRYLQLHHTGVERQHLSAQSEQIPIYVQGEKDGRFDAEDYIEFLGQSPFSNNAKNRYTRWNIYWLSVGDTPGLRVAEIDASPTNPGATYIPSFRSKLYFEEDHLHSNLQYVTPNMAVPSSSDSQTRTGQNRRKSGFLIDQSYRSVADSSRKNRWFDAVETWFWTGVKNSGDFNQIDLEVPLFDLAKSFDQPRIEIELQGGTPTEHEALVSINDIRIDFAKWDNQNKFVVDRTLRLWNNLKDASKGEINTITLARVDSTTEENTTRYPYHIYINSFSIEFTRLLKAVNDVLDFATPASDKTHEVRRRRNVEYRLQTFLSPEVEIFEYDGQRLLAKLNNAAVQAARLGVNDQNRLRKIELITRAGLIGQRVPEVAYDVAFQVSDAHDGKYIAASNRGVKKPDRIEIIEPNDLLETTNGADYIIIAHPVYTAAAQRLADWRSTDRGGGFRVKVADLTQIYDTFGHGLVSPKAIKAFLKYAYQNWQPPGVSYVVLLGDGTWDFRGVDPENYLDPPETVGYIPTHYIWTSSFGQTSSDHWYTTVSGIDELPDFYLGRLSVESTNQAQDIVDKIIGYESNRPNGKWRKKIISVADDEVSNSGDFIFRKSLNEIAEGHTLLGYETIKIFLEDVIREVKANPKLYGDELPRRIAKDRVIEALSQGSVIAQYAGHGGRVVWAHEAIFDNTSIDQLAETRHQPFMLVLSCYNGYFDKPGEPSMAEKLLRHKNGGIIAMLSATRLTYGSGNDALNRIIFNALFKRNIRNFGALSYDSKVELLATEGTGQIDVMLAYTLFGDPAMQLALSDYEVQPQLENRTTVPGKDLMIKAGQIYNVDYDPKQEQKVYTPQLDFTGQLEARAVFPGSYKTVQTKEGPIDVYTGDVVETASSQVINGRYSPIRIPVPANARTGSAHVEVYAASRHHIAVGGVSFSIRVPKIIDIQPELASDTTFQILAQVSDELMSDRRTGLQSVSLEWRNPATRDWKTVKMVEDDSRGVGWYKTPSPLPLASNTEPIRFQITATDVDGQQTSSEIQNYRPFVLPDLTPINVGFNTDALIYYAYSNTNGWEVKADIEQTEDFRIQRDIAVLFFSGNPDLDQDGLIDDDAKQLGQTVISPEAWKKREQYISSQDSSGATLPLSIERDPLNLNQLATATIPYQLPVGDHFIFVWVNPDSVQGSVKQEEINYRNNVASNQMQIRETLVGVKDLYFSPGGYAVSLRLPQVSLGKPSVLRLDPVDVLPTLQPSLSPATLGSGANAYTLSLDYTPDVPAHAFTLTAPVTVDLYFDWSALKMEIQKELGLKKDEIPDQSQLETIEAGTKQIAGEIQAYRWLTDIGKWLRVTSNSDSTSIQLQTIVTRIRPKNDGDGYIKKVRLEQENATIGKQVLLFTGKSTYRLYLSRSQTDGQLNPLELVEKSIQVSSVNDSLVYRGGVAIEIKQGAQPFRFGDVLSFEVGVVKSAVDESSARLYASALQNENIGDGILQLPDLNRKLQSNRANPQERWVILFLTDQTFQVEGEFSGLLATKGRVDQPYVDPATGLSFQIINGRDTFEMGDSFLFETQLVGRVQAETDQLGTFALMRSSDQTMPDVQLTVGKQNFISGDPVSETPLIQATISDDNGVNPKSVKLGIGQNNRNFRLLTDVDVSTQYGSSQVLVNYQSEELNRGIYQVRLTATDLDGNPAEKQIQFQVNDGLQLLNVLNYPNPFQSETTVTFELPSSADEVIVKIYTISGRLIWQEVINGGIGFMMVPWNGRDSDGETVANGVYYCKVKVIADRRLDGEDRSQIIKLMKLR